MTKDGYYHFEDDLNAYPDAWCFVVWSRRGPGKTYSSLWYSYKEKIKMLYMKRTIEDVTLICSAGKGFDPSPYVPINRDKGTHVKPQIIKKGVGGFYDCDPDDTGNDVPVGAPISYVVALNAIKSVKGFDFSDCDWMLLDEFIPQAGEIVKHDEGEMLLDVYMTASRDRQKRGRRPLKLILFANAENISTPITNTLEIVDQMADLQASGKTHLYDAERGILLHHITEEEIPIKESERAGIYSAMSGTAWANKAFGGQFSNNDFSNVVKTSLKNAVCMYHLIYKQRHIYCYQKPTGNWYICDSPHKALFEYDLNRENGQKKFWLEHGIDLNMDLIDDRVTFSKYSYYDLIANYKKIFRM